MSSASRRACDVACLKRACEPSSCWARAVPGPRWRTRCVGWGPRTSSSSTRTSGAPRRWHGRAAEAGFDGVELFEPDLIASPMRPLQIRDRLAELRLTLDLYQPFRDFEAVSEPDFARAEAKLTLMEELGAELLLVCSNVSPNAI